LEFAIRRCRVGDEALLSLLGKATFLEAYAGRAEAADILTFVDTEHSVERYRSWLESDFAKIWVAETANEHSAIGYAVALASPFVRAAIEINRLYVLHRFQHCGLGHLLINQILTMAYRDGIAELFLRVQKVNQSAVDFYSHRGFRAVGEERFRVGARDHAALVMRLALGGSGQQLQKRGISSDRSNYDPRVQSLSGGIPSFDWFSSSIVHDLRNPVATIYAGTEMLMNADAMPSEAKRLATNMYRAASRMRDFLEDASCASRRSRSTAEICEIREVIAAAAEAAFGAEDDRSLQVLLEVPSGIELALERSRIERVFFNLITNAFEAMPGGGQVCIRARKGIGYVLIEIEDTGPGLPDEIRGRVFEPFVTAGKVNGLGLGLALARRTVLDHGGDMWIETAVGARFVIRFPLNRDGCKQGIRS
jgi:ribosomal protein S18 acetylase RimI-like enzyme